jgi:hypothetical protein
MGCDAVTRRECDSVSDSGPCPVSCPPRGPARVSWRLALSHQHPDPDMDPEAERQRLTGLLRERRQRARVMGAMTE